MGYRLGDDKKSFDIFKKTCDIVKKIGNELQKNSWKYNKSECCYEKNDRILILNVSEDHIENLYISDESIDYEKLCDKYICFEPIYDSHDRICEVSTHIPKDTNIDSIVNKINNAPLIKKDKEFEM